MASDWQRPATVEYARNPSAGGVLKVSDAANKQLPRVRYHLNVYIEDGFARTTIDQVYFNTQHRRLEGRYEFPLPTGASISRLAMDVRGEIMEGGMVERRRAASIYEEIRSARRDPVLLEWIDGRTFSMRVFPVEPREHKRIILSYTQRLPIENGQWAYRFPGADGQATTEWSASISVKNAVGRSWQCKTHELKSNTDGGNLVLKTSARGVSPSGDLIFKVDRASKENHRPRCEVMEKEGKQYAMLRWHPDVSARAEDRNIAQRWAVIFEASADRDPVFVRQQIEVLRALMKSRPNDRFRIFTANTDVREVSAEQLDDVHLIGALDLERVFNQVRKMKPNNVLHLGAGWVTLGESDPKKLVATLPRSARYIGAKIGQDIHPVLMDQLAEAAGGFAGRVIDPDDLLQLIRRSAGRDVESVTVSTPDSPTLRFLVDHSGGELFAVAQLDKGDSLPTKLTVRSNFAGGVWERQLDATWSYGDVGYLPRKWARLEIDRLVDAGIKENRAAIVALSQRSYVMSPLTSLLVLEDAKMHAHYGVERGRDDHWAQYPVTKFKEALPKPDAPRSEPSPPVKQRSSALPSPPQIKFPKPMFIGTPIQVRVPNLERPGAMGRSVARPLHWRPMFAGEGVRLKRAWRNQHYHTGRPRLHLDAPSDARIISRDAPVTASDSFLIIGDLEMITDGDKEGSDGSYVELEPGQQWVQIDLGKAHQLFGVVLWHFHKNPRAYIDVVVQVSEDPEFKSGVQTLFNNDHDNSSGLGVGADKNYIETCHGRIIDVPGTRARYLRLYSNGNSSNEMNHYTEVEVWGRELSKVLSDLEADIVRPWAALRELENEVEAQWQQAREDDEIDLDWLRYSHAKVLSAMSKALESGMEIPEGFGVSDIMRIADRWWGIDAGSTSACHMAAALMRQLGREDLRWAYLTTPIATVHGSSNSWRFLESHGQAIDDPPLERVARLEADAASR